MAIPAVKLIPVPAIFPVPAVRSQGAKQSPQSQSALADLRWSRVEEFFRSRELRPNTHKSYEREFKAFLGWTEKGWQDITARDLDRYKEYLKALPSGRGGKRSTATINLSLSALQSLFKWLCARDYIDKDPMILIEKPKADPVESNEWSADEVKRLFKATQERGETEPRDRALLWVLLHGLRAREVEALNLEDFDGQRVHVKEAKDDSVGQVPLLPEAIESLEVYLNFRRCWGEVVEPESPLFLSESNNSKGQRLSYWGIYKVVKDLAEIAGVKNSHPHRGRHTIATEMVSRGMDPLLARQITRHKSEKSFERYSKRALQKQAEAQFLDMFGDGESMAKETILTPKLVTELEETEEREPTPDEELSSIIVENPPLLLEAKIRLWLRVENNNKYIRRKGKVRKAIERYCLSRYRMEKLQPDGCEYWLTISYEDEQNLERQIGWLRQEIFQVADSEYCFIEADFTEEGSDRAW